MARLTKAQLRYLTSHDIDVSETLDASGLSSAEWKRRLTAEGKLIAYGVFPCKRGGHSLRAKGGCIQCFPATIKFARRSRCAGYVYLAYSEDIGRFKIGFSEKDPDNRIYIANCQGYGEARDWKIRLIVPSDRAGKIEEATKQSLAAYRCDAGWVRNEKLSWPREVFDCDHMDAIGALMEHLNFGEVRAIIHR